MLMNPDAENIANSVENSFQTEIRYLNGIAYQLENSLDKTEEIMSTYDEGTEGITYGIIDIEGKILFINFISQSFIKDLLLLDYTLSPLSHSI